MILNVFSGKYLKKRFRIINLFIFSDKYKIQLILNRINYIVLMSSLDFTESRNNFKIGILSFFREEKCEKLLYEEMILNKNFLKFPEEIKKHRQILIYMTFFQIFSSIIGMFYIVFRRSIIYFFINFLGITLAICGLNGAVQVNQLHLMIHCVLTTSIIGAFFIYQLLELFLVRDTSYGVKDRMNDNILLFLFSLPYLYDFMAGVFNYMFLKKISDYMKYQLQSKEMLLDFDKDIKNLRKRYSNKDVDKHLQSCPDKMCIICIDSERDTIMNPCGHVVCCFSCTEKVFSNKQFSKNNARCPICRKNIQSFKKLLFA